MNSVFILLLPFPHSPPTPPMFLPQLSSNSLLLNIVICIYPHTQPTQPILYCLRAHVFRDDHLGLSGALALETMGAPSLSSR